MNNELDIIVWLESGLTDATFMSQPLEITTNLKTEQVKIILDKVHELIFSDNPKFSNAENCFYYIEIIKLLFFKAPDFIISELLARERGNSLFTLMITDLLNQKTKLFDPLLSLLEDMSEYINPFTLKNFIHKEFLHHPSLPPILPFYLISMSSNHPKMGAFIVLEILNHADLSKFLSLLQGSKNFLPLIETLSKNETIRAEEIVATLTRIEGNLLLIRILDDENIPVFQQNLFTLLSLSDERVGIPLATALISHHHYGSNYPLTSAYLTLIKSLSEKNAEPIILLSYIETLPIQHLLPNNLALQEIFYELIQNILLKDNNLSTRIIPLLHRHYCPSLIFDRVLLIALLQASELQQDETFLKESLPLFVDLHQAILKLTDPALKIKAYTLALDPASCFHQQLFGNIKNISQLSSILPFYLALNKYLNEVSEEPNRNILIQLTNEIQRLHSPRARFNLFATSSRYKISVLCYLLPQIRKNGGNFNELIEAWKNEVTYKTYKGFYKTNLEIIEENRSIFSSKKHKSTSSVVLNKLIEEVEHDMSNPAEVKMS